jgi:hypothetical protein
MVWGAAAALAVATAAVVAGERLLLTRLAADPRPADVRRSARRAGMWLLALAWVALAQLALILTTAAGADPIGRASLADLVLIAGFLVLTVTVAAVTRPRLDVLAAGLVSAAAQEIVFRGAGLALLDAAGVASIAAVAVAGAAFAASRLPRGRSAVGAALVAGVALGAITTVTGTVLVAIALHTTVLVVVAALGHSLPTRFAGGRAAGRLAATPGVGCGSHDPNSPACLACPLAAQAGRTVSGTA